MAKSDQPPADDRVYDIRGFEAELFWEKNRSIILVCLGIALVLAAAIAVWFIRAHSQRQAAAALFAEAKDPAAWRAVIEKYPGSAPTANAYLLLAENMAVAGKTDEALAALQSLREKDGGSYAAPFAALLEGRIIMRSGKFDEARKVFTNLVSSYPRSPAARTAGAQLDAIVPFLPPEPEKTKD